MNAQIAVRNGLALTGQAERELLSLAREKVCQARQSNELLGRTTLQAEAMRLRLVADYIGAAARELEALGEALRPLSARELAVRGAVPMRRFSGLFGRGRAA